MGCDIHLFVEVRETRSAPWRPVLVKTPCSWCKPGEPRERECYFCKGTGLDSGYHDRSYNTFAILADVRNYGPDQFVPITQPRGLPDDLSPELCRVRDRSDEDYDEDDNAERVGSYEYNRKHYGCSSFGDHSHSWLTVAELLACDWERTIKHSGHVSAAQFAKWAENGGGWPESWCQGVAGPGVKIVDNDEMRSLLASGWKESTGWPRESYYTLVEWEDTYAASSRRFHSVFLPELAKLGERFGNHNVRIVFGFDS